MDCSRRAMRACSRLRAVIRPRMSSRSSATVANSDASAAHSSSASGSSFSRTCLTRILERGGPTGSLGAVDLEDVTGSSSPERLVGPFGEHARSHLVDEVGRGEILHRLAVPRRLYVDGDDVAVPRRPLDVPQLGELLAHPIELGLDLLLGRLRGRHGHHEALVTGDRDLRADLDDGVEGERPLVLARGDVDLGSGDRVEGGFLDRLGVVVRKGVPDHLLPDRFASEAGLEQSPRHLPGPEPGNAHLTLQSSHRVVDSRLQLLLIDLDGELDLVAFEHF